MIKIDGSEGGGQLLRTALSLSAITQKPFEMANIRGAREKGGLKPQHLEGVKAISKICDAEVDGAKLESKSLIFKPGKISGGNYKIDIGTAGSITLILQTLIPALLYAGKKTNLEIKGGTDVKWAPSFDYFYNVPMRFLEMFGVDAHLELVRRGFYPKGNGLVKFGIHPNKNLKKLELTKRGNLNRIDLFSYATKDLEKADVIERQRKAFEKELGMKISYHMNDYVDSLSSGDVIHAHAHYSNTIIGADMLGERGKKAEDVGKELARKLKSEIESSATVDSFMADQILIFLALAKGGKFITSKISNHVKTNIKVIEQFLDIKFSINGNIISCSA